MLLTGKLKHHTFLSMVISHANESYFWLWPSSRGNDPRDRILDEL